MLGHLTIESGENQSKQGMYESEFNLIVVYLIEQEENKKRTIREQTKERRKIVNLD